MTRCVGQLHCQASHSGGGFTVRLPTAEVAAGVVSLSGDPQQRWLHGKVTHSGSHSFTAAWPIVEVVPLLGDSQWKWQLHCQNDQLWRWLHCQVTHGGYGFTVRWPTVKVASLSLLGDPLWKRLTLSVQWKLTVWLLLGGKWYRNAEQKFLSQTRTMFYCI